MTRHKTCFADCSAHKGGAVDCSVSDNHHTGHGAATVRVKVWPQLADPLCGAFPRLRQQNQPKLQYS